MLDLAALFSWRVWHVPAPMRAVGGTKFVPEPRAAGLPDLILLHEDPPRLIFAELKGQGTTHPVTDEQREFLRLANLIPTVTEAVMVGGETLRTQRSTYVRGYVWTPDDRGAVEEILKSRVLA